MGKSTWQDATVGTITRIQQIMAKVPKQSRAALYAQAQTAVRDQGLGRGNATEYWNTFVNSLRTLAAGLDPDADPQEYFDNP